MTDKFESLEVMLEQCCFGDTSKINHLELALAVREVLAERDAMAKALKDAATSLETISRLAGKSHYVGDDGERLETYMGHHDEVRSYAASRASVAIAAMKGTPT